MQWQTEGCAHLGARVLRFFPRAQAYGTVEGWVPAGADAEVRKLIP
jgi:hypothetical protein